MKTVASIIEERAHMYYVNGELLSDPNNTEPFFDTVEEYIEVNKKIDEVLELLDRIGRREEK
jgi:hypothetical protein